MPRSGPSHGVGGADPTERTWAVRTRSSQPSRIAAENVTHFTRIINGDDTGPRHDIVALNAGAALVVAGIRQAGAAGARPPPYNGAELGHNDVVAAVNHVMTISRNGQESIPVETRSRWNTRHVVVVDLGDRVVMRPLSDDAVGDLEGKYRGRGPSSERSRQRARREESAHERRR